MIFTDYFSQCYCKLVSFTDICFKAELTEQWLTRGRFVLGSDNEIQGLKFYQSQHYRRRQDVTLKQEYPSSNHNIICNTKTLYI
jgi:hypothetical protein